MLRTRRLLGDHAKGTEGSNLNLIPDRRKCPTFRRGQALPTFSPEGPLAVRFQRLNQANALRSQADDSAKAGFDFLFNVREIRMNQTAFRKLEQEISLVPLAVKLPPSMASDKGEYGLSSATVPVDRDIFRKIVIRANGASKLN
jgi:hypothetical protein